VTATDISLELSNRQWSIIPFAGLETVHVVERQGLVYLAGYIARKVSQKISCQLCIAVLHSGETMDGQQLTDDTRELYTYLSALSRGGLLVATDDLIVTLARCRNVFKQLVLRDDFLREGDQLEELMECATLQLAAEHDALFSCHEVHREYCLQLILRNFFNLSLNRLSRERTVAVSKAKSRKLSVFC